MISKFFGLCPWLLDGHMSGPRFHCVLAGIERVGVRTGTRTHGKQTVQQLKPLSASLQTLTAASGSINALYELLAEYVLLLLLHAWRAPASGN